VVYAPFYYLYFAGLAGVQLLLAILFSSRARGEESRRLAFLAARLAGAFAAAALGLALADAYVLPVLMTPGWRSLLPYTAGTLLALGFAATLAMLAAVASEALDIRQREALECTERRQLESFRFLSDAIPQMVWRRTADGRSLFANARWFEYTGRPQMQGYDVGYYEALHPDDLPECEHKFAAALQARTGYQSTHRIRGADGSYRYFLTRASPKIEDGEVVEWIGTSTDVDDQMRAAIHARILAKVGRFLARSLDRKIVLENTVTALVPDLADWVLINLRNPEGELVVAAAHHRDPARNERVRRLIGHAYLTPDGVGGSVEAAAAEAGIVVAEVTGEKIRATVRSQYVEQIISLGVRSSVVVPLLNGGEVGGTLNFVYGDSVRRYTADDLDVLEEIGRRVALALDNAERYAREHHVAQRLQEASLPSSLPALPGVVLHAVYQAGGSEAQVGGDWYDVFELADGRLVLSVGDVIGSGLEAAVTMGAVRQAIRGAAAMLADPARILNAADLALAADQHEQIVTAFIGILDPLTGSLSYASAGHPPPFVRRPDGAIERLEQVGLPIGLRAEDEETSLSRAEIVLEDDALLVLYTDGLTEARRDVVDGERRLMGAIASLRAAESTAERLRAEVLGECDAFEARDDVAILTVRLTAARRGASHRFLCPVDAADAVSDVRRSVVSALAQWGLARSALFNAELAVGELLANVARHARGTAEVVLELNDRRAVIYVRDRGPGIALLPSLPAQFEESGRGLFIVSKLVAHLGVRARPGGGSEIRVVLSRAEERMVCSV
jgi:serine phosphatase RsbU (regulator of sigma subunit)/PAS domain-containing protein/anti-sigma regulatory factor (Ser/Thr protein kinase)